MLTLAKFSAKIMVPTVVSSVRSGLLDDAILDPEFTEARDPDV